ncbi:aspartyl/glutamyl-tRNA amidotransferase subunit C [Patescibacteria group bacterium]|nr:aspartyl/glutamyl-tRNA amidotransferase subunit C [Patescibacteria group bacterium]
MHIERSDIDHLAELAHMTLQPGEAEKYEAQISAILSYVSKLSEVEHAAASLTGSDAVNVWRDDVVVQSDAATLDALRVGFPAQRDGLLTVPGVFMGTRDEKHQKDTPL